ncbi:MAG: hypothetical protein NUK57_10525 [Gudongella sp.]|nr:hypothetical protein [Gudongella sp.]
MKRDGIIIVLVLIVSAVCFSVILFSLDTVITQYWIVMNRYDNVQAEMSLEGKVAELVMTSENANNLVKDTILNNKPEVYKPKAFSIPIEGMEDSSGTIKFSYCDDGRLNYLLSVEGTRNKVIDNITVKGHVFNPIVDHCDEGLVTLQDKSLDYVERLDGFLDGLRSSFNSDAIDSSYFLAENYLENEVIVRAKSSGYRYIDFIRESHMSRYSFWSGKMVLFKEFDGFNRDSVRLEELPDSLTYGLLMGVIYLEEGDLVISGDMRFGGIIVLNNGRIIKEGDGEVIIKGKVIINNYDQPDEGIIIEYDSENVRLMSKFLPGFISPTIDSIR